MRRLLLLAGLAALALSAATAPARPGGARLHDYYPVDEGGKCGFIDAEGRYVVPARYDRAEGFAKGLAAVTQGSEIRFIDPTGRTAFTLPPNMRSFGFDERDETAIVHARTGKGFIDLQGRIIVPPVFYGVRPFGGHPWEDDPSTDRSTTIVQIDDERFAVIDRSGRILYGPRDGRIAILPGGEYAAWNVAKQAEDYYDRGFRPLPGYRPARPPEPSIDKRKVGRIDAWHASGYAQAQRPQEELEGGWGIIDSRGEWAVPPVYDTIYFNEDADELSFIHATRGGKWGFVDISGREVIPFRFDDLLPFVGNHAPAAVAGRWGLIDRAGNWKLEPRFDAVEELSDRAAAVQRDELWGVVDYAGRWLIEPRFRSVGYCQGRAYSLAEWEFEPEPPQDAKP